MAWISLSPLGKKLWTSRTRTVCLTNPRELKELHVKFDWSSKHPMHMWARLFIFRATLKQKLLRWTQVSPDPMHMIAVSALSKFIDVISPYVNGNIDIMSHTLAGIRVTTFFESTKFLFKIYNLFIRPIWINFYYNSVLVFVNNPSC